jgi:hypothetical protein
MQFKTWRCPVTSGRVIQWLLFDETMIHFSIAPYFPMTPNPTTIPYTTAIRPCGFMVSLAQLNKLLMATILDVVDCWIYRVQMYDVIEYSYFKLCKMTIVTYIHLSFSFSNQVYLLLNMEIGNIDNQCSHVWSFICLNKFRSPSSLVSFLRKLQMIYLESFFYGRLY